MAHTILQINLNYSCSEPELKTAFSHAAPAIAQVPGLSWKIWIINAETQEAGGLYAFETEAALHAYLASPIIAALRANPIVSQVQIKTFAAIAPLTEQTRGPIPALV